MSSICRHFRTASEIDWAKPLIAMACEAVAETRQLPVDMSLPNNKLSHRRSDAVSVCC